MANFPLRFNPVSAVHGKRLEAEAVTAKYVDDLKKDLVALYAILPEGIRLELSGGLAIPLTFECFPKETEGLVHYPVDGHRIYRPHHAFHLSVYAGHLEKLCEALLKSPNPENRYKLVYHPVSAHGWMVLEDWKADAYWPTEARTAIDSRKDNLRFVRLVGGEKYATPHKSRLDYFDVYPYLFQNSKGEEITPWHNNRFAIMEQGRVFSEQETYVFSWDKGELRLPFTHYKGLTYDLGGVNINLAGLNWIKLIKERRKRQDDGDRFDIQLIEKYMQRLKQS